MATKITTNNIQTKTSFYTDVLLDLSVIKKHSDPNATSDFLNGYDIEVLEDEKAVLNSIKNLFSVRKGEVYLNPDYGLPLYRYIAEPLHVSTAERIGEELHSAILKWEPRVTVQDIYVVPNENLYMYHIKINLVITKLKKQLSFSGGFSVQNDMGFISYQ